MTDRDLERDILDVAKGRADALNRIYAVYRHAVYTLSAAILRDHHAAEDVSQEVFLKIWAKARTYRIGSNPKAWIMGITRNEAITSLRNNRREYDIDDEFVREIPERELTEDLVLDSVSLADRLGMVPSDESEIILLRVIGGLTVRDISKLTGIPYTTVCRKYQNGISVLGEKWDKKKGDD